MHALRQTYAHFVARTDSLAIRFQSPIPSASPYRETCPPIHEHGRLKLLVRLQHLWAEFCHELVVASALGDTETLAGTLLAPAPGVVNATDIENVAKAKSPGAFPPWHDSRFAVGVAAALGVQNLPAITNGLSAVSPAPDLNVIRNYVVHPNKRTRLAYARVAQKLGQATQSPAALLAALLPGGATRFHAWVTQLQLLALNAVR